MMKTLVLAAGLLASALASPSLAQNDDPGTLPLSSPVLLEFSHYLVLSDQDSELQGLSIEHETRHGIRYVYRFRTLSSLMAPATSTSSSTVQVGSTWSWADEAISSTVFAAGGSALSPWPGTTWTSKGMVYTRWTSKNSVTCVLQEHEVCTPFDPGDSARTTAKLHAAQVEALQGIYPPYEE